MKLSATIKALKKNTLITLTTHDVLCQETHLRKRETKQKLFIEALSKTTHLKNLTVTQYTYKREHPPIVTLAELFTALSNNGSLEFLDISHNHLEEDVIEALSQLIAQPTLPLKQIYIDYVDHSAQVNLTAVIEKLEQHAALERLSLRGNELTPKTCESLLQLLHSQNTQLKELLLSHCIVATSDLEKIQLAALAKGKKFSLSIENVATASPLIQKNTLSDYSSLMLVRTLTLPKAPLRLSKSDGDATLTQKYKPLFSPASIAPAEEISPHFSLPKSQSETDINSYREKATRLNFN